MSSYISDVFLIIFLFFLFGVSHSYLASLKFKTWLSSTVPDILPFYRLIYNILALISFYLIYELSPKPDLIIYELNNSFDLLTLIPQVLSLIGIFWAAKYFSLGEFTGFNQAMRYFNKKYDSAELDERLSLRIEGPYKYSRHPIYFFSIMFLIFRPVMSLFYLVFILCIIAYFYIGSIYEERKLVKQFGDEYENYAKNVPRILPYRLFSPYK